VRRGKVVALQIADPGMLAHHAAELGAAPLLGKAGFTDAPGGAPQLDLAPEEIVIHVDVDARFQAE
jgi:hypothetical protein